MKKFIEKKYSDHKRTIQNIGWRGLQIIGKQGITFLIFIISAKLLSPYEFGIYNYAFAIILLLAMFGDFGISTATSKYTAEYYVTNKDKLRSVLFNSGLIILCLSLLIASLVLSFGHNFLNDKYAYVLYVLPLVFLVPMTSLYDGIYRGLNLFKKSALISLAIGLIFTVFVYLLINLYGLAGALISQNIFYLILLFGLSLGYRDFKFGFNKEVIKELGKYSIIVGIGSIGFMFYTRIDILFLGHYNYIQEIAYYEIVNKILAVVILPLAIIAQVIAPNITQKYVNREYAEVYRKYKKYLLVSLIFATAVTALLYFSKDFLLNIFLHEYANAEMKIIFNLMLIIFFTQMLNGIIPTGFVTSTGHAKISTYFLIIFGMIHIILNYIFVYTFGYIGIIYSIVLTKGIADIIFLIYYRQTLKCLIRK